MGVQVEYVPHIKRLMGCCGGRVDFVSGHGAEGARGDRAHIKITRLTRRF